MKSCRFTAILGALAIFASGCHSMNRSGLPSTESNATIQAKIQPRDEWGARADLPTFGTPSEGTIRILIDGYSVNRPGNYHLSSGTTVQEAIDAAQGLTRIVGWQRSYSGIQRKRPDGSVETIWFTREGRAAEEKMMLQDGDHLRVSHEVF
jgi:hypothetical protein